MISASPSPSATSCTRQSTSPFTSVRGAQASRGLPSSYWRSGSAGATTRNFSRLVSIGSLTALLLPSAAHSICTEQDGGSRLQRDFSTARRDASRTSCVFGNVPLCRLDAPSRKPCFRASDHRLERGRGILERADDEAPGPVPALDLAKTLGDGDTFTGRPGREVAEGEGVRDRRPLVDECGEALGQPVRRRLEN